MKRFFYPLMIICIVITAAASLSAREIESKFFIGGSYDIGITYPGGELPYEWEPYIAKGTAIGINGGYMFTNTLALTAGIEYANKPFAFYDDEVDDWVIRAKFIDYLVGVKFIFNIMTLEAGLFYGVPTGDWDLEFEGTKVGTYQNWVKSKEIGSYFGIGALIDLTESLSLEIGTRFAGSHTDSFDNDSGIKLRSRMLSVRAGLLYFF